MTSHALRCSALLAALAGAATTIAAPAQAVEAPGPRAAGAARKPVPAASQAAPVPVQRVVITAKRLPRPPAVAHEAVRPASGASGGSSMRPNAAPAR